MAKTDSYTVLTPLIHDNKSLAVGSTLELTPQQAHWLVLNGSIVKDIAPLPPIQQKSKTSAKKDETHE